jgi:hypothetical protein
MRDDDHDAAQLDAYRAHLRKRLVQSDVPAHLHEGLTEYIVQRRPMGDYLTAVCSNDLKEAVGRADDRGATLHTIIGFLYNYAPSFCWGSPANVQAWLANTEPVPLVFD